MINAVVAREATTTYPKRGPRSSVRDRESAAQADPTRDELAKLRRVRSWRLRRAQPCRRWSPLDRSVLAAELMS